MLIIDADPQGTRVQGWAYHTKKDHPTFYELIISRELDPSAIKETQVPNLSIITSNTNLAAAEVELANVEKREFVLGEILDKTKILTLLLLIAPALIFNN